MYRLQTPCTSDQLVTLSDFRGQPVILAFYPADWSPVCGDHMALYNEVLPEFRRFNAELMGISSMARGATPHSPRIASSGFPCWRTSNQKAPWRELTARTRTGRRLRARIVRNRSRRND